jgi:hypothetical protein
LFALTAVAATPTPARAQTAPASDAFAAYDEQAVGVRHLVVPRRDGSTTDAQGHLAYSERWDAFTGSDHHPIDEAAFYRIVGRDDLLRRYQARVRIKTELGLGGGVLVMGGALFAMIAALERSSFGQPACIGCVSAPAGPSPSWGLAIAGTGLATLLVRGFINPTPIDADEADRMARDHDRSLRDRLGLIDTAGPE